MAFNLDEYEPVEKRITDFWERWPNGRIHTVIVSLDEKQIIVRAEIFTDRDDHRPVTVDHAQEKVGGSGMTANSWLEIACTSAIGRGLATLGLSKKGKRPSREEMIKARGHDAPPAIDFVAEASKTTDLETLRKLYAQANAAKADKMTLDFILQRSEDLKN